MQSEVSVLSPGHVEPPHDLGGLLQERDLVLVPLPHVALQEEYGLQDPQPPFLGQHWSLQSLVSIASPLHWLPPGPGSGLLQFLVLI